MSEPRRPRPYELGVEFPTEGFVQAAIERTFGHHEPEQIQYIDFACINHTTGERWRIEAKGETSATGLDFRTGLGQLLCHMDKEGSCFALAMPDTAKFRALRERVPDWVRGALGLHWLLVDESGEVTIDTPPRMGWEPEG
jgi:hypothetical protein